MFAADYLDKSCNYKKFIEALPSEKLGMIIVIPCFKDPDIFKTIESLKKCNCPEKNVEVIIVVNEPENSIEETIRLNQEIFSEIKDLSSNNNLGYTNFYTIYPPSFPYKWAGAGLARKTGMDEAVRRFHFLNKPDGIIISLDADTLVEENYLTEIEKHFKKNLGDIAATISFRHQTEGLEAKHKDGILLYEKYMMYYKSALAFTGYPFAMYTIGSAFCVKAEAYVRQGGMNKRKAGEDFYFLQKLTSYGNIGEISSTCVYPSARLSERVPFGTGPVMIKWMEGDNDLTMTYNSQAFKDLKVFFDRSKELYKIKKEEYQKLIEKLPDSVKGFLSEDRFFDQLTLLNKNCSSEISFEKKFYQLFNALKILKFINWSHKNFYIQEELEKACKKLGL